MIHYVAKLDACIRSLFANPVTFRIFVIALLIIYFSTPVKPHIKGKN